MLGIEATTRDPGLEQLLSRREHRAGIAHVFEDVAEDHGIERARQRRAHFQILEVTHRDALAVCASGSRRRRVRLDADHRAAGRGEQLRQVAAGASDVEHASSRRNRVDHHPVAVAEPEVGDELGVRERCHQRQDVSQRGAAAR